MKTSSIYLFPDEFFSVELQRFGNKLAHTAAMPKEP